MYCNSLIRNNHLCEHLSIIYFYSEQKTPAHTFKCHCTWPSVCLIYLLSLMFSKWTMIWMGYKVAV